MSARNNSTISTIAATLEKQARACETAISAFESEDITAIIEKIKSVTNEIGKSWSGSFLGYHANVYYLNFRKASIEETFDPEWGLQVSPFGIGHNSSNWTECDPDGVIEIILSAASLKDYTPISKASDKVKAAFINFKKELLTTLDAYMSIAEDRKLINIRERTEKLQSKISINDFFRAMLPAGKYPSHDMRALRGGIKCPPHLSVLCNVLEMQSCSLNAKNLVDLARETILYLEKKQALQSLSAEKKDESSVKEAGNQEVRPQRFVVRKFLKAIFVHDSMLEAFLIDNYPDIKQQTSNGMDREQKFSLLIEQASQDDIMQKIEEQHPSEFVKNRHLLKVR